MNDKPDQFHPTPDHLVPDQKTRNPRARDWFDKGQFLCESGNYLEAISAFESAIKTDLYFAEAYFRKGVCHYMLGNYSEMNQDMDAAVVLGCSLAQLWSRFDSNFAPGR